MDSKNLESLLQEIHFLRKRRDERLEKEETFNVFEIMYKWSDEVHLHSRFLSTLLNPQASHKKQDLFLKLFLKHIDVPFDYDTSSVEVFPNESNWKEYKEIDIFLVDLAHKSAVIIENKIRAKDSNHEEEGQLERYYRRITQENSIPADRTHVIYLSIDRDGPSDESVCTSGLFPELRNKIKSIHYENEILDWLKECVKECNDRPALRESLNQYIKLIERMTFNTILNDEIKSLMHIIGKDENSMKAAKFLIENKFHLHWWAIRSFWTDLSESFINQGFRIRTPINNSDINKLVHYSNRTDVAVNLSLMSPNETVFTISSENDCPLGIGILWDNVKKGARGKTKCFVKDKTNSLDLLMLEDLTDWAFFKEIKFSNEELLLCYFMETDSKEYSAPACFAFELLSESKRKEVVETIVSEARVLISTYESYL